MVGRLTVNPTAEPATTRGLGASAPTVSPSRRYKTGGFLKPAYAEPMIAFPERIDPRREVARRIATLPAGPKSPFGDACPQCGGELAGSVCKGCGAKCSPVVDLPGVSCDHFLDAGPKLLGADPVAWVLYNISGPTLPVWRAKGMPPDQVKVKVLGEARGAMMNLHALQILPAPVKRSSVKMIWSVAGPSDALALLTAIPHELRDRHLVITNAAGETADVLLHQAELLAGLNVAIVRDRDPAGETSEAKWVQAIFGSAKELRVVRPPFEFAPKSGKDLRDYLNGGAAYTDLMALAAKTPPVTAGDQLLTQKLPPDPASRNLGNESSKELIDIDPAVMPLECIMRNVTDSLIRSGKVYLRAKRPTYVDSDSIFKVEDSSQLGAVLNTQAEVKINGMYQPLPAMYANNWLKSPEFPRKLPTITLYSRHPIFGPGGNLAHTEYNRETGIYYAGPPITPTEEKPTHLPKLLSEFCFQGQADRTNFIAILLTPFFADLFIGAHPVLVLNGNQPGLGKSTLAQICAILRSGEPVISLTYNPNEEEFEKSLGACVRQGVETIVIDNAKNTQRNPMINSSSLERSITAPILSYRLLGQSSTIEAENSHQFIITANSPEVGPDLMQRSIVSSLYFEGEPSRRRFDIPDAEGYCQRHRVEILSELAGYVARWFRAGTPRVNVTTRFTKAGWGEIIGGILAVNNESDFLANADKVAGEMDQDLNQFETLVEIMVRSDRGTWTATELLDAVATKGLFRKERDGKTEKGLATWMGGLATKYHKKTFVVEDFEIQFEKISSGKNSFYQVRQYENTSRDLSIKTGPAGTLGF